MTTAVSRARVGHRPDPSELAGQLADLIDDLRRQYDEASPIFARVHPTHRRGAENLIDYLALRHHDLRPLQADLAELGLSSLGRAEEHVMTSLERALAACRALAGGGPVRRTEAAVGFNESRRLLEVHATELLGPPPEQRTTRILVTMPTEAADDPAFARELLARGMNCARVNTAHDTPEQWARMIAHVRAAAADAGVICPILMDLPGPKLRTGPIAPGPRVLQLHPTRDARGRPIAPAIVTFVDSWEPAGPGAVPVDGEWLAGLAVGDLIRCRDAREDRRVFEVTARTPHAVTAEVWDTTYLETGIPLLTHGGDAEVGELPPVEQSLHLSHGDVVTLRADLAPADPGGVDGDLHHVALGCTLPAALDAVRVGQRVWFDDGRIGGRVSGIRAGEADVTITDAGPTGARLRAGKGINLPDTVLNVPAVDDSQLPLLRFIVDHADIVALSFAQRRADVLGLRAFLDELGGASLGVVVKVETARGFAQLPDLLVAAMAGERVGVMVARGDLAVECGFERLAEIQEEILWLCDAAHVPVIWATEVLDQMAHTGRPSRAEVTDAAMSAEAECVMLNKGPYVIEAVAALDDILTRMAGHQRKKSSLLRTLHSWSSTATPDGPDVDSPFDPPGRDSP